VELTRAALDAAEKQGALNAFITLTPELALEQAKAADRDIAAGIYRSPLHGVPIALKDLFDTKGIRTTAGSRIFEDRTPDSDSVVTTKLAEAGSVMIGKTNQHELAYGITSDNPHFGAVRNPWDLERTAGGSSGGSGAAVAAGIVPMAMGTDTGGSIRIPAAFCGCVGLKPTFGRVSKRGVLPLGFTLDHSGPIADTVRDAAITLEVIAGYDPAELHSSHEPVGKYDPGTEPSIAGVRVGVPDNFFLERADAEVVQAVHKMAALAESLGAQIVHVRVPDMEAVNAVARVILLCEASAALEPHHGRRELFGNDVRALLDQGRLIPATDYINAQRLRRLYRDQFNELWCTVDCLFTPCTPTPAPKLGEYTMELCGKVEDIRLATTGLLRGINPLGLPALAVPTALSKSGLPMSLQIVGPAFAEGLLLRVGAALEDERGPFPAPPPR
jgi:aspartyl-tRNA(Asn)/glutamyl-tRNA(Gln) amidotransferase subunit A